MANAPMTIPLLESRRSKPRRQNYNPDGLYPSRFNSHEIHANSRDCANRRASVLACSGIWQCYRCAHPSAQAFPGDVFRALPALDGKYKTPRSCGAVSRQQETQSAFFQICLHAQLFDHFSTQLLVHISVISHKQYHTGILKDPA
jgi:hypothetical protein